MSGIRYQVAGARELRLTLKTYLAAHAEPLGIWLALRVGLSALVLLAWTQLPHLDPGGTAPFPPYAPADRLLGPWSHWDGLWYLQIATAGYHPADGTTAFLPLYPWLVGALSRLPGLNPLLAGVLLSSAIFAAALVLFHDLVRRQYAPDLAGRAVLYLAIFPTAFFFWAIYSEGLFLLLALGMFVAVRRGHPYLAAACASAALWTRPFGILLLPPLLLELWNQVSEIRYQEPNSTRNTQHATFVFVPLVLPAAAGVGLLAWAGGALGDPLAFVRTQDLWNRAFHWPWETVASAVQIALAAPADYIHQGEDQSCFYLATLGLFGGLAGAGWVRGWLRPAHALYLTLGVLFPLLSGTPRNPLLSLPRFVLVLFPAFILLALAGRRPWLHYLILVVSLLLLALYTIRFAGWFWVA